MYDEEGAKMGDSGKEGGSGEGGKEVVVVV